MKVLIISGGSSSEREISLISAKAVKQSLESIGYATTIFDLKKGLPALKKISINFDVLYPVLHGEEGESGKLQKFLSTLNKPFVGKNFSGFKTGHYKVAFKKFCLKNNIPTADWRPVKDIRDIISFGLPAVLKNSEGGSSREVIILHDETDLNKATVKHLLSSETTLFAERFLSGIEVTVGVLNGRALPVIEIIPPEGQWFDYKNKYSGKTQEIPNAPSLSEKQRKSIQKIAENICKKLELGSYPRVDFIISAGKPHILEVNTIPGFTPNSLFPKSALADGITFDKLNKLIVESACK